MANVTWKNLDLNKLNKTLKHLNKTGVLTGPRASKGSYGDLANMLQESTQKLDKKKKGLGQGKKSGQKGRSFGGDSPDQRRGRKGMGIAVKGGGRIL